MSVKRATASSFLDLVNQLDAFLVNQGHAWGRTYAGTGTGKLLGTDGSEGGYIGGATSVAETFTITATSATNFTVTGSVSGAMAAATVGTPYTSSKVNFLLQAGGTPFVSGDTFTLNTTPPWARMIRRGILDATARTGVNMAGDLQNAFDTTDGSYATSTTLPCEIRLQMIWPGPVGQYAITCSNQYTTRAPRDWTLDYSDDGVSWTAADTKTGVTWSGSQTTKVYAVPAVGDHAYWRLRVTAVQSGTICDLSRLTLKAAITDEFSLEDEGGFVTWRAPGPDGLQQIYVSAQFYVDAGTGAYNLRWTGHRFWDAAKRPRFQNNNSGERVQLSVAGATNYTFIANGHRLIPVIKAGSAYYAAYLGFRRSYDPPSADAWPMTVGGNVNTVSQLYSAVTPSVRNFWNPARDGMAYYRPDTVWQEVGNIWANGGTDAGEQDGVRAHVYPSAPAADSGYKLDYVRDNLDGSYSLIPCLVIHYNVANGMRHCAGELDGVYWVSGFNQTAENTIALDGFVHLAIPNINRTGVADFAALRLD